VVRLEGAKRLNGARSRIEQPEAPPQALRSIVGGTDQEPSDSVPVAGPSSGAPSVRKGAPAGTVTDRLEPAAVEQVRVDRSDPHHDAVVAQQREQQLERRSVVRRRQRDAHGLERVGPG